MYRKLLKYQQRIKQGTLYLSKVTRFEDTKGVIRSRKSKKDGQYIGQKNKNGQYICQKKKDGQYIGQKRKDGQYISQKKKDGQYISQKKNDKTLVK
jgi:hypothetical protein